MLIQVFYPDNRFDYVKDTILGGLIETGRVMRFRRLSGWVTPGIDPVRTAKREYVCSRPGELKKLAVLDGERRGGWPQMAV